MYGRRRTAPKWRRFAAVAAAAVAVGAAGVAMTKASGASAAVQSAVAAVGVLVALAAVVGAVKYARAEREEDARKIWGDGPRRVADALADEGMYDDLGVETEAPEALDELGLDEEWHAPYLPRRNRFGLDVDSELCARMKRAFAGGTGATLVVLGGPSKSGKSRTLLEALGKALPDALMIKPLDAGALAALAYEGPPGKLRNSPWVLWLDDLEPYVRYDDTGLNVKTLRRFDRWPKPVLLVGAVGGKGRVLGDVADPGVVGNLLRDAPPLYLDTELTPEELAMLREHPVYSGAADQIARDGIAEFMVVATKIRDRLIDDDECAEGVAVVRAAIQWRRSGLLRPIPEGALQELYTEFLPGPPSTDRLRRGLEWATERIYSRVALLTRVEGSYSAYDYAVRVEFERWPISRATLRRVLEHYATDDDCVYVGAAAAFEGEREVAEAAYKRADEAGSADAANGLGVLLDGSGDLAGARAAFRRADERGSASGAENLGKLFHREGNVIGAMDAYRRADERGSSDAANNLGALLADGGNSGGAEAAYKRADERGSAAGARNLAVLLYKREDKPGALAAIRRADQRGSPEAASDLGVLLAELGDVDEAEAAYRRAEEQGNARGAIHLGTLLKKRGDRDGAAAAFGRAADMGDPEGAYRLGMLLFHSGMLDQAESALRWAVERGFDAAATPLELIETNKRGESALIILPDTDESDD